MNGAAGRAALFYFAVVFAGGFVLGTMRVFLLIPAFGPLRAVLIELPFMLLLSWLTCGWAMRRFAVRRQKAALVMGAAAFVFLMAAELALARFGFGQSVGEFLRGLITSAGAVGLAGQLAFALFPVFRLAMERR